MSDSSNISSGLSSAAADAAKRLNQPIADAARLENALAGAIDPRKLLDNLAEVWRTTNDGARTILESHGFGPILAKLAVGDAATAGRADEAEGAPLASVDRFTLADGHIRIRTFNPVLNESLRAPKAVLDGVAKAIDAFLPTADNDVLGVLYRSDPLAYAKKWLAEEAPKIDAYIRRHFGASRPKYIVNSGIGANEQFSYFVSALANARDDQSRPNQSRADQSRDRKGAVPFQTDSLTVTQSKAPNNAPIWLLANSPRDIVQLPADATIDNTLFMEFSRSGITQETVKQHELTPRAARRIVFANSGPLRELALRDGNLLLELPDEVSGRYGRNKTPILMAPMYAAGLDVPAYWHQIDRACATMPLSDAASTPVALARYLRVQQLRHGVNHIYLGSNDPLLVRSADEFCQYWNEGVNRDGNDITMSRYLGLPRDSHMNLEAILGTSERKMAVFLLRTGGIGTHPLLMPTADAIDPAHKGLSAGDVDLILALANVKRCSEKMPTILIAVEALDLKASAWLGQLWADVTLVYSRLIGVDAGSNPEVKAVRTRAAEWLADKSAAMKLMD